MRTTSLGQAVNRVTTVSGTTVPALTVKLTSLSGWVCTLLKAWVISVRCSLVTLMLVEPEVLPVVPALPPEDVPALVFPPDVPPLVPAAEPPDVPPAAPPLVPEVVPDVPPDPPDVVPELPPAEPPDVPLEEPDVAPDVVPEPPPDAPPVDVEEPPVVPPALPPALPPVLPPTLPPALPPVLPPALPPEPPLVWAMAATLKDRAAAATVANKVTRIVTSRSEEPG